LVGDIFDYQQLERKIAFFFIILFKFYYLTTPFPWIYSKRICQASNIKNGSKNNQC